MPRRIPNISKEDREKIQQYHSVKRWVDEKDPETVYAYCRYMVHFTRQTGKTPDEFLAWAETQKPVDVQDLINQAAKSILRDGARFNFKVEMRSFLRTNGYNNLPKSKLSYTLKTWHRGYKKEEARALIGFLDKKLEKFYGYVACETGFRARTILGLRYGHIKEDWENNVFPVAIRLGPEYYGKKKSAGFSFLGRQSVKTLRDLIAEGVVKQKPDSVLFPVTRTRDGSDPSKQPLEYTAIYKVLERARVKAGLNDTLQPSHAFRKFFENGLDQAQIDVDQKRTLEGHFEGTRGKHYNGREWSELRPVYAKAIPFLDVETGNPELEAKVVELEQKGTAKEQALERRLKAIEDAIANATSQGKILGMATKEEWAEIMKKRGKPNHGEEATRT